MIWKNKINKKNCNKIYKHKNNIKYFHHLFFLLKKQEIIKKKDQIIYKLNLILLINLSITKKTLETYVMFYFLTSKSIKGCSHL
jgi:hypothetical protein